jgi:hypothetical protein
MSHGAAFTPIASSQEHYESGFQQGTVTDIRGGSNVPATYQPQYNYYGPLAGGAVAVGAAPPLESDQVPLTREIDDFQRAYHDALDRIREEDGSRPATSQGNMTGGNVAEPQRESGEGRPLWQQNRRQSRNLMWM